ncbi:MAG: twin-arginine translocase TatA/TatE family subunit [Leptospirales bacterium]
MLIGPPGMWELLIILAIVLLVFGAKRLPGLARSLGSGITEFKKGISGQKIEDEEETESDKEVGNGKKGRKTSKKV